MNNTVSGRMYHNPDRMKEYAEDRERLAEIGCLAAGLIHEINNPLNFILINFATLTGYFCKYRKVIAEVKTLHALKSKNIRKKAVAQTKLSGEIDRRAGH